MATKMRQPEYWDWVLANDNNARNADPDPYALASSFYGPGVIFAWYMVLLAVLVELIDDAIHGPGPAGRIRFSAELFAVLSYPAIAAGHLLVRLAEFPHAERGEIFPVLLDPILGADFLGTSPPTPPSITAFQHGVGIEGPARVVQNFVAPLLSALLIVCFQVPEAWGWPWGRGRWWLRTGWVGWLILAVYWWCCLTLLALAAVGWRPTYLACYIPFVLLGQLVYVYGMYVSISCGLLVLLFIILAYAGVGITDTVIPYISLFLTLLAAVLAYWCSLFWPLLRGIVSTFIVPDTGVSFGELDQVATAVTAVVTLMVTLWNATGSQAPKRELNRWWRATIGHGSGGSVEEVPLNAGTDGAQLARVYAA